MAHQVQVNADAIVLPDGREYDSGAVVTLTDREFSQIRSSLFVGEGSALTDLGEVAGTSGDLSGLGDVIITDPQPHDVVKWDGTHWVNAQPDPDIDVGGGVGGGGFLAHEPYAQLQVGPLSVPSVATAAWPHTAMTFLHPWSSLHLYTESNDELGGGEQTLGTYPLDPPAMPWLRVQDDGDIQFHEAGLYALWFSLWFEANGTGVRRLEIGSGFTNSSSEDYEDTHPSGTDQSNIQGQTLLVVSDFDTVANSGASVGFTAIQSSGAPLNTVLFQIVLRKVL